MLNFCQRKEIDMKNQSTPKAIRELLEPARLASFVQGIGEVFITGIPNSGGIINRVCIENETLVIYFGDFFVRKRDDPEKMQHYTSYRMPISVTRACWQAGNVIMKEDNTHTIVLLRPSAKSLLDTEQKKPEELE